MPLIRGIFKLGKGKRHGGSCHKQEKWNNKVTEPETNPRLMIELI